MLNTPPSRVSNPTFLARPSPPLSNFQAKCPMKSPPAFAFSTKCVLCPTKLAIPVGMHAMHSETICDSCAARKGLLCRNIPCMQLQDMTLTDFKKVARFPAYRPPKGFCISCSQHAIFCCSEAGCDTFAFSLNPISCNAVERPREVFARDPTTSGIDTLRCGTCLFLKMCRTCLRTDQLVEGVCNGPHLHCADCLRDWRRMDLANNECRLCYVFGTKT